MSMARPPTRVESKSTEDLDCFAKAEAEGTASKFGFTYDKKTELFVQLWEDGDDPREWLMWSAQPFNEDMSPSEIVEAAPSNVICGVHGEADAPGTTYCPGLQRVSSLELKSDWVDDWLSLAGPKGKRVSKASMEYRLVGIDVKDAAAMASWAHGMCRGQTVERLAKAYGVEPTMDALLERMSRYFPEEAQGIVVRACEAELKKTEAAGPGSLPRSLTAIPHECVNSVDSCVCQGRQADGDRCDAE